MISSFLPGITNIILPVAHAGERDLRCHYGEYVDRGCEPCS
jgi:hypothetical protein